MTTAEHSQLFAKIAAVMGEVRVLSREGRNTYDKYDYVTADKIASTIGSALAKHGIAFLPSVINVQTAEHTVKSGTIHYRTTVHMSMTLACTETGAVWTMDWFGEAIDRSDKSINKAIVSAIKYFLLKTFLVAGGDEDDADALSPVIEHDKHEPAKPAQDADKLRRQLHAELTSTFGENAGDDARHWAVQKYTMSRTPNNVRESSTTLTPEEMSEMVETLKNHRQWFHDTYSEFVGQQTLAEA
jgi:hypothetical protein